MSGTLTIKLNKGSITQISLNRPSMHNAFDDQMIQDLLDALDSVEADETIRCLVLRGDGKSFCAGADLNWMRRTVDFTEAENYEDSLKLSKLMDKLDSFPKPTIAVVHGNVYGGGVGLAACCDIVLAERQTRFCLSEVKLGLIPAIISPYVVRAIGERLCRRYFLTGEIFTAEEAMRYGLVHALYDKTESDSTLHLFAQALLQGAPKAQKQAKILLRDIENVPLTDTLRKDLAHRIAHIRIEVEAQERLKTFLTQS